MDETARMHSLCAIARSLDIPFADDSPPGTGFIPANGLRMHTVDWGHGDKPALLFLHGASMTAHTWDLVCLALRHDYHCIALDQRGHGRTDGIHAFGVEEPREDIHVAVQALGLRRFALVGMSMGGNNGIAYAGEHAETLAAMVFVDVCPTVLPAGHQDIAAHHAAVARSRGLDEVVEAAHRHNPRGSREYLRHTLSYSAESGADGYWRMRYTREVLPRPQSPEYLGARREALWACVPRITCPTLVVHGEESLAQSRDNLEHFRSRLHDARLLTIPGASHDVQEDRPRALIEALKAFFASIPGWA